MVGSKNSGKAVTQQSIVELVGLPISTNLTEHELDAFHRSLRLAYNWAHKTIGQIDHLTIDSTKLIKSHSQPGRAALRGTSTFTSTSLAVGTVWPGPKIGYSMSLWWVAVILVNPSMTFWKILKTRSRTYCVMRNGRKIWVKDFTVPSLESFRMLICARSSFPTKKTWTNKSKR